MESLLTDTGRFFLLAFPALFSIINPVGGAFVFLAATQRLGQAARNRLASRVTLYSFITLLAAFLVGGFVLRFFGISVPVLRVAGGIIIALTAWRLLHEESDTSAGEAALEGADRRNSDHLAYYPLTMPLTTGPGTISVSIALGTGGAAADNPITFGLQILVTAIPICVLIYVLYRWSGQISQAVGATATAIIGRLAAFLLFCIGIQVLWTGIAELVATL